MAVRQQAAPKLLTDSRNDVQPLAEQHDATAIEMASPGGADNGKRETKIQEDSPIAEEVDCKVEMIKNS